MAVVFAVVVASSYLALERASFSLNPVSDGRASVPVAAPLAAVTAQPLAGDFLLPPRRPQPVRPTPDQSVTALSDWFAEMNYDLEHIRDRGAPVPHAYLVSLPPDLSDVPETEERKRLFFQAVLPLILRANQEILADRRRLWQVQADVRLGRRLAPGDRLWLVVMADRYKVARGDIDGLLQRVDVVPPSLALAQAAEESGWGTSRFAQKGNAIFGQWTTADGRGLVPMRRDEDKDHKVRKFDELIDSVRAYMLNLNTHNAYRELRRARAELRRAGDPLAGLSLARFLTRYSERGDDYVRTIRGMIQSNGLDRLDDARLMRGPRPEA